MQTQITMDRTGDTRHQFDTATSQGVADAEKRFMELTGKGFRAAKLSADGEPAQIMKSFDKTAEKVVFFPSLQGG